MPHLSPQTLTRTEREALLAASRANLRDHCILSMAIGTGLRLGEIAGLDVGDLYFPDGTPRVRIRLRAAIAKGGRAGDVFLPDALVGKLRALWAWKLSRLESLVPAAPVFCSQRGHRLSKRRVQLMFKRWQLAAGFDRLYPFHALRHSAVTAVYRSSRDLFLTQRFARHASPLTTILYMHTSDDELLAGVRSLDC